VSETESDQRVSIEMAVEAVLMTTDKSVKPAQIADAINETLGKDLDSDAIRSAVESLNSAYKLSGRSFTIESIAGGFRILAKPELAGVLASFHGHRASTRLSRAALETLSIVAYRQPVTRAEVESIRGVACGEVLRSLMDRRLVTIAGRAEELGRPMLYGTTRDFLTQFGLANLKDLPEMEDAPAVNTRRIQAEESPEPVLTTDGEESVPPEPTMEGS
jgi:segregation and condensation protein B